MSEKQEAREQIKWSENSKGGNGNRLICARPPIQANIIFRGEAGSKNKYTAPHPTVSRRALHRHPFRCSRESRRPDQ